MEQYLKRPAWIEIDLSALEHNYKFIRRKINSETKIAAVVKANAYGHGAAKVAKKLSQLGVEYFCVGSPDEGIELREAGIKKPILVLAEVLDSQYQDIIKGDLIQTAASINTLKALNQVGIKANKIIKVHLKFDTGMGRIGFFPEDLLEIYQLAEKLKNIKVEGVFSHFARADEKNKEFSFKQLKRFKSALNKIKAAGFKLPQLHIANSAAVIDLAKTSLDLVRPGIMLYGLLPSNQLKNEAYLKPLLSFKTRIVQLRTLPAGSAVSYGSTYTTEKDERIAVLPIGYKDGYPRLLSNQGEVLINGKRAPIRGRVCMGQTIVSVEQIENVEVGDEVVLIGKQSKEEISATEIADLVGTINYEIICNLSERLKRIYL
ncbi:alanine racemase [Halanaerobium kushneri]|uniref:Alanine racemase n=1 Tax=Halanaerobium kushneri TaxID=56779 RepID=A0A1N6ZT76_9FIRM|nr:alanine racemase [Halanaerobium kushneri]SIR29926.1 alanine racemase [Halanaerobium kushneri]